MDDQGNPAVLPVEVSGPDRERVTVVVDPRHDAATVGDLADALGLPRGVDVLVDGAPTARGVPLDRGAVVRGSRIVPAEDASRADGNRAGAARRPVTASADPPARQPSVVVTVEAGPDVGGEVEVGVGRHVIGRASAASVRIADSEIELHHAALDVSPNGHTELTQLAGRVPLRWHDDAGHRDAGHRDADAVALVGSSRLRFTRSRHQRSGGDTAAAAALTRRGGDPWRRSLQRAPRTIPAWDVQPVPVPATDHATGVPAGGLVAAACSVLGGVTIAFVLNNPLFLVFSAVGLIAAIGTRFAGRLNRRKEERTRRRKRGEDHRRFVAAIGAQRASRAAYHRSTTPTAAAAVRAATAMTTDVWKRRPAHGDAFRASLGWGRVRWDPVLDAPQFDRSTGDRRNLDGTVGAAMAEGSELAAIVSGAAVLDDVPVGVDLGKGTRLAIAAAPGADHAAKAVARSVLVQLAAFTGPADWRLVIVTDRPRAWGWAAWLPHVVRTRDDAPAIVAADDAEAVAATLTALDDGDGRHVVVVTDRAELLANRTGALRRFLDTSPSAAAIAVVTEEATVPSWCSAVVEIGSRCRARWQADVSAATEETGVHVAGVTVDDAEAVARRLAAVHDPEDPAEASGAVPAGVTLSELLGRIDGVAIDDPIAIATQWRSRTDADPSAAIGVAADGVVDIDIVRDGPHALVAGTTGAGKSELLRTFVASLASRSSPDDVTFVLVDYKGGSTFDACADLPHTVGLVTDLDEHLAARALTSLDAEIRRRERILRSARAEDLAAYRALRTDGEADGDSDGQRWLPLPRLVVVIDEFAALAGELPDFLSALVGVAQRGRSLGIHLVLATQRPSGVVSEDIRANTNLRIALRLNGRGDATDIVGDAAPAGFARGTPGRAMVRLGPSDAVVFQAATSLAPHRGSTGGAPIRIVRGGATDADVPTAGGGRSADSELAVLTNTIRAAASLAEIATPFHPWLPELPVELGARDVAALLRERRDDTPAAAGVVGVVDDPAQQRRLPLRWDHGGGNLVLIGSRGAGTSTALTAVVAAVPAATHVYVIDARGDGDLAGLAAWDRCAAVVDRHDAERRARVLDRLAGEVAARQSVASSAPANAARGAHAAPVVLAIDGLAGLVSAVSGPGESDEHAALVRIVTDGVAVGVHCVATMERPGGVPATLSAAFGQRWLFHLDDPAEAPALGVRADRVPPPIPGRMIVAASRLDAQVARPERDEPVRGPARAADGDRPAPIETLPADVDAATLPASVAAGGATQLTTGLEFATLAPAVLDLPDGEHAIVLGPARSGRSTTLAVLAAAWLDAHPGATVVVRAPRPSSPVRGWAAQLGSGSAGAMTDSVTDATSDVDLAAAIAVATGAEPAAGRATVVVIDDAERVADDDQMLLELVSSRRPDVAVLAAGRPDALRPLFGHWTAVVRRGRIGLVMTAGSESDAELFGETVPRRLPIGARRGLAWQFDSSGRKLVQAARLSRTPLANSPACRS